MSELQLVPAELAVYDEEQLDTELAIRNFCIQGLAHAVPEYMEREKAADLLAEWFPGDQLAIAALYKQVSAKPVPTSVA